MTVKIVLAAAVIAAGICFLLGIVVGLNEDREW